MNMTWWHPVWRSRTEEIQHLQKENKRLKGELRHQKLRSNRLIASVKQLKEELKQWTLMAKQTD